MEAGPALATRKSRLANPYGGTRSGSAPAGPAKSAPNPEDLVLYSRTNDGTYVRCVAVAVFPANLVRAAAAHRGFLGCSSLTLVLITATRIGRAHNRMKCPKCDRSNFLNQQGFINHCRHSHRIKFSSHEEAKRVAGVPVVSISVARAHVIFGQFQLTSSCQDESEVPPDHPCRSQVILEYMVKVKALKEEGCVSFLPAFVLIAG